jgi:phage recombination protein Bet
MSTALNTLTSQLASQFNLGDGQEMMAILKATAFKGPVNDAQMSALLLVANQYGLNPFTKEIYAFPDKNNGIVPVVGVDGWARIINNHPQFNGMDFEQAAASCTCIIHRKDRDHPIRVTEYLSECVRSAGPWLSHPKRMLRHKAMIQCARLAFGFSGIVDPDEAERVLNQDAPPTILAGKAAPQTFDAETGEILGNLAPNITHLDLDAALIQITQCTDYTALEDLWALLGKLATELKDRNAWRTIKLAVNQRRLDLTAATANSVETTNE